MLLDEVYIYVTAGRGGNGFVHFLSNRWNQKGGPDGGNGGNGGDIYFEAKNDLSLLNQFRNKKKFSAENGGPGGPNNREGKRGEDLVFKVPVGTLIQYDNGDTVELTELNQKVLIARGGEGGYGNTHFKSSTNTTPESATPGFEPKPKKLFIQLKMIADIGLVGLPNAGKSSLLNELTSATARVANYPFTTLEPNLGVTPSGKIIADIPGLIDGASGGKGLGYKFLKHIERTKVIVHCLSCDSHHPEIDYQTVRKELENYSSQLASKKEIIVLTKSDLVDEATVKVLKEKLSATLSTSIIDTDSIKNLLKQIESIS